MKLLTMRPDILPAGAGGESTMTGDNKQAVGRNDVSFIFRCYLHFLYANLFHTVSLPHFPLVLLVPLGGLDMRNLLPDLGVEDRAEVVAKLAVEIVEPFVGLISGGNLDASVLLQGGDVGSERFREGDERPILEPTGIVVDREEDTNVVGGIRHPGVPDKVSDSSKG